MVAEVAIDPTPVITPAPVLPPAPAPGPGIWSKYVVPGSAVAGAAGVLILSVWLTFLTLEKPTPGPAPLPPPPPPDIGYVNESLSVAPGEAADLEVNTAGNDVAFIATDGLTIRQTATKTATAWATVPGKYKVHATTAVRGKQRHTCAVVTVGTPTPPVPPVPPVPPSPPTPIPGQGLRVLIVYDSSELSKYPPAQVSAMNAQAVRDYLIAKCAKGPDSKTPEYRVWDKDINAAADGQVWQDAMKHPRQSLPWVIIGNGTTGFEGPLPASPDDMLKLLKQYGG